MAGARIAWFLEPGVERLLFALGVLAQERDQFIDRGLAQSVKLQGDTELLKRVSNPAMFGSKAFDLLAVLGAGRRENATLLGVQVVTEPGLEAGPALEEIRGAVVSFDSLCQLGKLPVEQSVIFYE